MNKLASREAADNETTSDNDESEEAGEAEEDEQEEEEEESGSGSGQGQEEKTASRVRSWKPRRQFNSAMGISIDRPMSQPQTNAYNVHNAQQGSPPWQSSSNDDDSFYYYYYYYYDEDVPLPKRKSRRQPLKPKAGRMLSPVTRRRHRPPPGHPHHVADARRVRNDKAARGRPAEKDFRLGQLRSFAKWKKSQN